AGVAGTGVAAIACGAATTAAVGSYVGLMCLRADRVGDSAMAVGYGLAALTAAAAAVVQPVRTDILLGVTGVQAMCIVLCRGWSLRRWRNVDWLTLRIPRIRRAA